MLELNPAFPQITILTFLKKLDMSTNTKYDSKDSGIYDTIILINRILKNGAN